MIQAVDNKIIVMEMKRTKTAGGIVLPSTVTEPQAYGKVISLGSQVGNTEIKEGDIIVYHKMGGQAISMNNKILCCVPYPEVFGVLTDETVISELEEFELTNQPTEEKPQNLIQRI